MVVHLGGKVAEMDYINKLSKNTIYLLLKMLHNQLDQSTKIGQQGP